MDKTGFTMDFSDFDKKFYKLVNSAIPERAEKGLFQAGAKVIDDCITKKPKAPHKTGHLHKNQLIIVMKADGKFIGVLVGFNVPYAAPLHEAPSNWNWTLEGSGPKYLETKLAQYRESYMKFVADYIKEGGS